MYRLSLLLRLKPAFFVAALAVSTAKAATDVRLVPALPGARPANVALSIRGNGQERLLRVDIGTPVELGDEGTESFIVESKDRAWWWPVMTISNGTSVEIPIWPVAELSGTLLTEKGVVPPDQLEAGFELKHGTEAAPVRVACTVDDNGRWKCRLPETHLDLRLAAPDFAPHYVWDVTLSKEKPTTIAPFTLKRGGSIAGWIRAGDRELPIDKTTVRLTPILYGGSPDDVRLLSYRAAPNRRGFFQFTAVPAGNWAIVAEASGLSPSRTVDLSVDDRNESTLRDPLLLRDLVDLRISIEPHSFAEGVPWRVRLQRREPHARWDEHVAESDADRNGEWRRSGTAAGEYHIDVVDHRGATFNSTSVAVEPGMTPVQIAIDAVPVQGRVHIGENGVAARLEFHSGSGEEIWTSSSSGGTFRTMLTREGSWGVDVRLLSTKQELTLRSVPVARKKDERHAVVDLALPTGRLAGQVVDESGKPLSAGVIVTRNGSPIADLFAENGDFELVGIEQGPASIQAAARGTDPGVVKESGVVDVMVGDRADPLRLVLRSQTIVEGWIRTPSSEPVVGAFIRYWTPTATFLGQASSSPSGRFTLDLEPGADMVHLTVVAPGLPGKLALVPRPANGQRLEIVMNASGGRLIVPIREKAPPWPTIGHNGTSAPLLHVLPPFQGGLQPPPWVTKDGVVIDLEPGEYTICATREPSSPCVREIVVPGATTIVDTPLRPRETARNE